MRGKMKYLFLGWIFSEIEKFSVETEMEGINPVVTEKYDSQY